MESNISNESPNLIQRTRKALARLRNFKEKVLNEDFREFMVLEYQKVKPEDIKDIKRLRYLRNLDLAQTGYVNSTVSNLITYYKKKQEVLKIDQEVIPIGRIRVKEQGVPSLNIQLGYSKNHKGYKVAYNHHDNLPLWKSFEWPRLLRTITNIHPKEGDSLEFEHVLFLMDVKRAFPSEWQKIGKGYDTIISRSFKSNKYFEKGILTLHLDLVNNPSNYLGKLILFPFPQKGHQVLELTEGNDRFLVFQSYLKTTPERNTIYFTPEEVKELYYRMHIDQISRLRFNLVLGINEGQLFIGKENDRTNQVVDWKSIDECLKSPLYGSKIKHYLAQKIILKKDFVLEKDAIKLETENRVAFLKRHFNNGKWYYAESNKKNAEFNYRPIWSGLKLHLEQNFPNSKNLILAMNAIDKTVIYKLKIEPSLKT